MASWRLQRLRLRATAALACACIGFALALLAAATVPLAFGLRTYVVQSGSMRPAIDTGDLVVSKPISPSEARIGDIVMFKDPEGADRLISHRVRAMHERGGRFYFVTRGDANTGFEHWNVPVNGTIGEIDYRVPKLGFALGGIGSWPGRIALVVIPALTLLVLGLIRIWRPESQPPEVRSRPDAGGAGS
jgi:signal peptidase